jgi:hypothetical protein
MELDVDALEKLRRLDEERYRQEVARQKAIEAEQAKAAEAAAAGKAADTAPPMPPPNSAAAASADPNLPQPPQAPNGLPGARPYSPKQQTPAAARRRTTGDEILNQLRPY